MGTVKSNRAMEFRDPVKTYRGNWHRKRYSSSEATYALLYRFTSNRIGPFSSSHGSQPGDGSPPVKWFHNNACSQASRGRKIAKVAVAVGSPLLNAAPGIRLRPRSSVARGRGPGNLYGVQ